MGPMRFEDHDMEGLHDLCQELVKPEHIVVEIGCYWGEGSGILAHYAKKVYCIDPWVDVVESGATKDGSTFSYEDMIEAEAHFDLNCCKYENIIKIRAYSDDMADIFANQSVDLVYIDSLHSYAHCRRDIDKWWRIVRPGGWISGHNYGDYWPGVLRSVNEFFDKPDKTYKDTSWAVQKRPRRKNG